MMASFSPSSVRAGLMIAIWAVSQILLKPQTAENSIAIAAWILILINPYYLLDTGFIYSFIIVFCLVRSSKITLDLLQSQNEKEAWIIQNQSTTSTLLKFK